MTKYKVGSVAKSLSCFKGKGSKASKKLGSKKKIKNKESGSDSDANGPEDYDNENSSPERTQEVTTNASMNDDKEKRTIFVGNLPLAIKKTKLKNWFSKFGRIETIRLRNAPLADPREPKKVAILKKNFHPKRTNIGAYIRYETRDSAIEALVANGLLFHETHHIRVDLAEPNKKYDQKKAIFIGNAPFGVEEEQLRSIFKDCGVIENVRVIRDHRTGIGKGVAFVDFKQEESVELALQLNGVELENRELRVKRANSKGKESPKKPAKGGAKRKMSNQSNPSPKSNTSVTSDKNIKKKKKSRTSDSKKVPQAVEKVKNGEAQKVVAKTRKDSSDKKAVCVCPPPGAAPKTVSFAKNLPKKDDLAHKKKSKNFQGLRVADNSKSIKKKKVSKQELRKKKLSAILQGKK